MNQINRGFLIKEQGTFLMFFRLQRWRRDG